MRSQSRRTDPLLFKARTSGNKNQKKAIDRSVLIFTTWWTDYFLTGKKSICHHPVSVSGAFPLLSGGNKSPTTFPSLWRWWGKEGRAFWSQAGCGSKQPGVVVDNSACDRGVETRWSLRSFSTQAILWFYSTQHHPKFKPYVWECCSNASQAQNLCWIWGKKILHRKSDIRTNPRECWICKKHRWTQNYTSLPQK